MWVKMLMAVSGACFTWVSLNSLQFGHLYCKCLRECIVSRGVIFDLRIGNVYIFFSVIIVY